MRLAPDAWGASADHKPSFTISTDRELSFSRISTGHTQSLSPVQIKMDWKDPLRKLPGIAPHPAPESVASSELSSIQEDSNRWYDSRTAVLKILEDRYVPNGPKDDTPKILRTFVMKLPKGGQLALMSEILLLKGESTKLRQLRNFLVDAILKPSMSSFPLLGVAFS